ncbi:MAG: SpoIIE family protein phosphatase [Firmicutes bacterium]|nr:SpoIIE family protein phosphatase [Bacillota bacterium]
MAGQEKDCSGEQKNKYPVLLDRDVMRVILFASVIIVFSMVLVGSTVYLLTEKEVVRKLKDKDLVYIVESVASKIDGRIERAVETSLLMARDPEIIEWVAGGEKDGAAAGHIRQRLVDLPGKYDYSNSFVVSATTGHYWAENGQIIDTMSKDNPHHAWFYNTLSAREPVSVVFDYNVERNDTFVFVDALIGDPNQPLGVAGVGLDLKNLSEEFQRFKYSKDSELWVVDARGKIYLSDNAEQNGRNIQDYVPANVAEQLLKNFESNNAGVFNLDYENTKGRLIDLISYPVKSAGWTLVLQIPRNNTVSFLNTIKLNTLSATLIALISITFFFYFVSRNLADPYKKALQQNQVLENMVLERTRELHEKNQKLLDSIDYAKRIQEAILPSRDTLAGLFKDYFLLWQPRDLVGGDFYWVKKFGGDFLVAVGDCTGHGVPGALMTTVAISILNQIVDGRNKEDPALILKRLNKIIKQTLKQQSRDALTDDGLDIGLCYFDAKNTLTFAGAKCSLFIRNKDGLRVVKGDRKSIGYVRTAGDYSFTNTFIDVAGNDLFYLTTDGCIDQNGGPKNYSFGIRRFVAIIDSGHEKPLPEQGEIFSRELLRYMGDESQRDDITVLGFKLL